MIVEHFLQGGNIHFLDNIHVLLFGGRDPAQNAFLIR
jgi:hypothetical protein